jgi:hypothetical protein
VVTVDVVVTDKAGNPITGLLREDFTVLDEGAPQALVNFDVVTGRAGEGDGDRAPEPPHLDEHRPRLRRPRSSSFDNINITSTRSGQGWWWPSREGSRRDGSRSRHRGALRTTTMPGSRTSSPS